MDHQGQHGNGTTTGADGYGNPVAGPGADTATGGLGHGAGPGGAPPAGTGSTEEHRSRGILRRSSSSSSSSSSSEDDGMGGRRKKGIKEKVKEKLPGGNKDKQNQQAAAAGAAGAHGQQGHAVSNGTASETHGVDATTGEKKGLMEKIKEKLPGHH